MTRMETYCKNQKIRTVIFRIPMKLIFFLLKKNPPMQCGFFLGCDEFGFVGLALYIISVAIETN